MLIHVKWRVNFFLIYEIQRFITGFGHKDFYNMQKYYKSTFYSNMILNLFKMQLVVVWSLCIWRWEYLDV